MLHHLTRTSAAAALGRSVAIAAAFVAYCVLLTGSAHAEFGVQDLSVQATNQDGTAAAQAGSHPFALTTDMRFVTTVDPSSGLTIADGQPRDIEVAQPAGVIGDPGAVVRCSTAALLSSTCPGGSQVGVAEVTIGGFFGGFHLPAPIYNVDPPPGSPAAFAFPVVGVPTYLVAHVRSGGDYGITMSIPVSQVLPILGTTVTLWGVPADPAHDAQRTCPGWVTPCSAGEAARPFLTNPMRCGDPLTTSVDMVAWNTGQTASAAAQTTEPGGNPITLTGCGKVPFDPSIDVQPTNRQAGAPAGYRIDVDVPQNDDPWGLAEAELRKAVVTLPEGTAVSPSAASGLDGCAPGQVALHDPGPAACPDASHVGTVEIDTPLLPEPLTGSVYLARPHDNPYNSLLALYLVAEGSGVRVKLVGRVDPDPQTGRLTTTFDDDPQLPFSRLRLTLDGGPRAALTNPPACGTYATTADLTAWTGKSVSATSAFTIDRDAAGAPCDGAGGPRFSPAFTAGVDQPAAGASAPFALHIRRSDADGELQGVNVTLPPGLLADLASVPACGAAAAAVGACPAASRIGRVGVLTGAGPEPLSIAGGQVYLTGGYRGAPFGLLISVPAIAGPFDLGDVNVRAGITLDPRTARVTVASDPLPRIVDGIPLRIRGLDLTIDRPGFMQNPTSCAAAAVQVTLTSLGGLSDSGASPFQVGGCDRLAFRPRIAMRLTGRGQAAKGRHPGLETIVTQGTGQAHLSQVQVALPPALTFDVKQGARACAFDAGQRDACPVTSMVGHATAVTPLLGHPLSGPVYLVQGRRTDPATGKQIATLPTLLVTLRGDVALDLRATTAVEGGRLQTTFAGIPDAAISRFALTIDGGAHGILAVGRGSVCRGRQVAEALVDGQNGATADQDVPVRTRCGRSATAAGRRSSRTRRAGR